MRSLWRLGRLINLAYPEDEREGWLGWIPRAPAYRPLRRRIVPYGAMIHTMGYGVIKKAQRKGWPDDLNAPDPFDFGVEYHRRKAASHFDIDTDATSVQLLPIFRMGAHANSPYRKKLLSGAWEDDMRKKGREQALTLWDLRWPGYKSPQHLFPSKTPNFDYVGIELRRLAEPRADGLLFTPEQHEQAARIAASVALLAGWPARWWEGPRSLGHEDTSPYKRWNRRGGWDPGALRLRPGWDWALYHSELERLS